MLSKNANNKKCAPKLIFFNEKKIEKDSDNFWYRKLTLKVKRLGDFALFDTSPLTQFSKFNNFLWVCWFLGKNHSNFVPPAWKLHNPYCHNVGQPNILVPLPGIFHTKYWTFTIGFVKAGNFFVDSLQTICRINPESQNITPA